MAEALDPFSETAVVPAAALVDIGDLAGPAGVEIALENIGGEVVLAPHRPAGRAARKICPRDVHRRVSFLDAALCRWRTLPQSDSGAAFDITTNRP